MKRTRSRGQALGELDDYEVALLSEGKDLAVSLAMRNLREAGVIDPGDGEVRAHAVGLTPGDLREENTTALARRLGTAGHTRVVGRPLGLILRIETIRPLPAEAHPVERAVYEAVADLGRTTSCAAANPSTAVRARVLQAPALAAMQQRLVEVGLLKNPAWVTVRKRLAVCSFWVLSAIALVLGICAVALDWDQPLWFMVPWAAAWMALLLADTMTTKRGRQLLKDLRQRFRDEEERVRALATVDAGNLTPEEARDRLRVQQQGRRLALFGPEVLWEDNPVLALALGLAFMPPKKSMG